MTGYICKSGYAAYAVSFNNASLHAKSTSSTPLLSVHSTLAFCIRHNPLPLPNELYVTVTFAVACAYALIASPYTLAGKDAPAPINVTAFADTVAHVHDIAHVITATTLHAIPRPRARRRRAFVTAFVFNFVVVVAPRANRRLKSHPSASSSRASSPAPRRRPRRRVGAIPRVARPVPSDGTSRAPTSSDAVAFAFDCDGRRRAHRRIGASAPVGWMAHRDADAGETTTANDATRGRPRRRDARTTAPTRRDLERADATRGRTRGGGVPNRRTARPRCGAVRTDRRARGGRGDSKAAANEREQP
jgi:hypothetical protein